MTAPRPLPPCPVCDRAPMQTVLGSPGYDRNVEIVCAHRGAKPYHRASVEAQTVRQARVLWRRLAARAKAAGGEG